MKQLRNVLVAIAVAATAAACGGESGTAASAASSSAALSTPETPSASASPPASTAAIPATPAVVTIKDFTFTVPATVPAGSTVQVKNGDGEAHTVTADSGSAFDTMVAGSGTASFTAPAKPGRYPFHCTYHGNMHGVLVVA